MAWFARTMPAAGSIVFVSAARYVRRRLSRARDLRMYWTEVRRTELMGKNAQAFSLQG